MLAAQVRALANEAHQAASFAARQQRDVSNLAQRVASAASGSNDGSLRSVLALVETAARALGQCAAQLETTAQHGKNYAALLAGGAATASVVAESTGHSAAASGRTAASSLSAFWSSHTGEYVVPSDADWLPVPTQLSAHSDPRGLAAWVNDGGNIQPGRGVNCADCARSFELSWRGQPQVSAARAPGLGGESFERIEEWLGDPLSPSSLLEIGNRLTDAGHGASAYVVVLWKGGGGHAFNAVNYAGTVLFIDAQPTGGAVDTWPPKRTSPGYGFEESDISETFCTVNGP